MARVFAGGGGSKFRKPGIVARIFAPAGLKNVQSHARPHLYRLKISAGGPPKNAHDLTYEHVVVRTITR